MCREFVTYASFALCTVFILLLPPSDCNDKKYTKLGDAMRNNSHMNKNQNNNSDRDNNSTTSKNQNDEENMMKQEAKKFLSECGADSKDDNRDSYNYPDMGHGDNNNWKNHRGNKNNRHDSNRNTNKNNNINNNYGQNGNQRNNNPINNHDNNDPDYYYNNDNDGDGYRNGYGNNDYRNARRRGEYGSSSNNRNTYRHENNDSNSDDDDEDNDNENTRNGNNRNYNYGNTNSRYGNNGNSGNRNSHNNNYNSWSNDGAESGENNDNNNRYGNSNNNHYNNKNNEYAGDNDGYGFNRGGRTGSGSNYGGMGYDYSKNNDEDCNMDGNSNSNNHNRNNNYGGGHDRIGFNNRGYAGYYREYGNANRYNTHENRRNEMPSAVSGMGNTQDTYGGSNYHERNFENTHGLSEPVYNGEDHKRIINNDSVSSFQVDMFRIKRYSGGGDYDYKRENENNDNSEENQCVSQCVFGYMEVLDENRIPSETLVVKWLQDRLSNDMKRVRALRDARKCFARLSTSDDEDGCEFSQSLAKCLNLDID